MMRNSKRIVLTGLTAALMLTAGTALAAVGFASPDAYARTEFIGEGQAKTIALDDAGVSESEALHLSVRLDMDDRVDDYDIEFIAGGVEYDYEIDAVTGDILERSKEVLYGYAYGAAEGTTDSSAGSSTKSSTVIEGAAPDASAGSPAETTATESAGVYYDDDWDDRYDDWDDRYDDWDDDRDDWDDRYDDDRDDYDDDWDDDDD